jgi:TP901 family phage tail tape measure protein
VAEYSLGTAKGVIDLSYTGAKAADQADADLKRIKGSGESTDAALRKVGNAAAVGGAAIVAGLVVATKSAADFEFQMSAISAVSGATKSEMDSVRKKALQLGADTAFSAGEAGLAMEELVKSGISIPNVLNGAADSVVALAAAGQIALPEAAAISAAAMNQFKLSASDLPAVADLLAGAANASATGVSEIGHALSFVGPIAHAAGLSIADTAASIAVLSNNGIDGMKAGTALRSILSQLQPITKGATETMMELGLITKDGANQFYNADGSLKGMNQIIGLLNTSMSGLTEEQKIAYTTSMFGVEALSSVSAMAGTTSDQFDALTKTIAGVSAADVAAERLNNFKGSMEQLRGSVETMTIGLGSVLLPSVKSLVDWLTNLTNKFSALSPETQALIVQVALAAAGMLLFLAGTLKVIAAAQSASKVVSTLSAAMKMTGAGKAGAQILSDFSAGLNSSRSASSAFTGVMGTLGGVLRVASTAVWGFTASLLANPITWIVVAVIALGVALWAFFTKTEAGKKMWDAIWNGIQAVVSAVVGWITGTAVPGLVAAWDWIVASVTAVAAAVSTAFNAVLAVIVAVWTAISTFIVTTVTAIWLAITTAFNAVSSVISTVFNFIVLVITTAIGMWVLAITTFIGWITGAWDAFWNGPFGGLVKAAWDLLFAIVMFAIGMVIIIFTTLIDWITAAWSAIWTWVSDFVSGVWNGIVAFISASIALLQSGIQAGLNFISNLWTTVWSAVSSFVSNVWNGIVSGVTAYINMVKSVISTVLNAISSVWNTVWSAVSSFVAGVWNSIYSAIEGPLNRAKAIVSTVVSNVWSTIQSIWGGIAGFVGGVWDAVYSAIEEPLTRAYNKVSDIIQNIKDLFSGAKDWLVNAGRDIIQGLIDGVLNMVKNITNTFKNITAMIPDIKGPPVKDKVLLMENGQLIMEGLISGITSRIGDLRGLLGGVTLDMPTILGGPSVALPDSALRTASLRAGDAMSSAASGVTAGSHDVTLDVTWNAAPNDTISTRKQLMSMLGRATNVLDGVTA